jgi:large subunit ribosomal protein L25
MGAKLTADVRHTDGKGGARKLRATGRVPGVVYGHGDAPLHISVDHKELYHTLHTDAGMNVMVDLNVDAETFLAMPRDLQRDPLRGQLLHVDFLRIARDEELAVEVPITLTGDSPGVKEGGMVEHHLWNLHIECLPQDVPDAIEADISRMNITDVLHVSDLKVPENVTVLSSPDEVVVAVVPAPTVVLEEVPEVAEGEEGEAAEGEEGAAEGEAGDGSASAGSGGSGESS